MRVEQFENFLNEDLGWRKKELSDLILLAEKGNNNEVLLKSVILLLYAHWEGYIKKSSKYYLKYVSESKKKLGELTDNFKAISLKSIVNQCIETAQSLSITNELSLLNKIKDIDNNKFKINIDINNDQDNKIINTESNLNPNVFKRLLSIIGLTYKKEIEVKESYLNYCLLGKRNLIGHGSKHQDDSDFSLTIDEIKKLRAIMLAIIDNFKEELIEYAQNSFFLISNQNSLNTFIQQQEQLLAFELNRIENHYKY